MNSVFAPVTNSGPLSERRCLGTPFITMTSANPGAGSAAFSTHQKALARVFIDQVEQPYAAAIMRPCADEVVTPHMVHTLRPEPHTRFG